MRLSISQLRRVALTVVFALTASAAWAQLPSLPKLPFSLPNFGSGSNGGNDDSAGNKVLDFIESVGKANKEITEEEEIAIGQEFAATLLGAKPLLTNPGVQRYVNTLGRWLASQTERPELPWTFGVLNDAGYNAFATPGGYIFITRGLLERMGSEAELAGVLSHEIAHVLQKHHLAAVKKNTQFAAIADGAGLLVKGNEQVKSVLVNFGRKLYASGLDQGDEFEADRMGVVIAARAGYDPFGLPAVLQMLEGQNGQDANFSLQFKTHPAPAERMAQLGQLMQADFDALPHTLGKPLKERLKEFK